MCSEKSYSKNFWNVSTKTFKTNCICKKFWDGKNGMVYGSNKRMFCGR